MHDHFRKVLDGWRNAPSLDTLQAQMLRENFIGKTCRLVCQTQVYGDATVSPL